MRKPMDRKTWIILRVSAILLIFFLGLHILVQHFSTKVGFEPHETRITLGALLIFAILHGLTGSRRIILDFKDYPSVFEKILTIFFLILGLMLAVIGFVILPELI